ncbi:MAG: DNA polymerase III subunit gamma/tau, partial [Planctomycetota bacterium]|nr:DNA polymerase III subunit gamma/tau [Planctomycetota bacterium]
DSGEYYEVIARRYRPRRFEEVVGQEAVAEALRQAILQKRLAHAYLFCGPRGVGKTSMARIFARTLQCPSSEDAVPCDECATCQQIFRGEDSDVTELDGASHRGIDDIRSLIEHVQYAPTQGPYRIFIIDEVHMLTREAFNALLKTLEEPPPHVKFIFATTEPERIIPTVLSRCQRCDFSSISRDDIVLRLDQICQQEGVQPRDGLLANIASLAAGGMRDAQSLLDQVLSFAGEQPGPEDLDRITGRVSPEQLSSLLAAIDGGDLALVVERLTPIFEGGTEASVLTEQLAEELRSRLHLGVAAGWSESALEANLLGQEILQETRQKLRRQDRGDLLLEIALMRMGTLRSLVPISAWTQQDLAATTQPTSTSTVDSGLAPASRPVSTSRQDSETDAGSKSESSKGGAKAAREALRKPGPVSEEVPSVVESAGSASNFSSDRSPEDQLLERLKKIDRMLPRKMKIDGQLVQIDDQWQLRASSSLFQKLESEEIQQAIREWEKSNGPLQIRLEQQPSGHSEADAGSAAGAERPTIIGQAEEIFSSEARNRGPIQDEDRIQG